MNKAEIEYRVCKKCHAVLPKKFFRKIRRKESRGIRLSTFQRSRICKGCEQTAYDERKRKNRFIDKARNTFSYHAAKYMKEGLVKSREDFALTYGWDVKRIAHDIEFHYMNGCSICGALYAEMGHGLADITLDIIDPNSLPFYETNVGFICGTCNQRKSNTSPEDFGEVMLGWRLWEALQKKSKQDSWAGTLFEGLGNKRQGA